jgi:tetratricopeptide (TPR) repeat protein
VLHVLARGGFGTVYLAEPEAGGRPAAIKLARAGHPESHLGLAHEIEVLGKVGPPHVPALLASGWLVDGTPYVVMEYLEAKTLADRMVEGTAPARGRAAPEPLPIPEVCALGLSILRALSAVHARGYVHCDLKPENVFVGDDLSAVLVDFGLVVPIDADDDSPEGAAEGAGAGTAEYMSPEQCEGRDDVDARADIYAFGVMLFELVAGWPPFWGPRTLVHQGHLSRRPPRLSAVASGRPVPAELDAVVARCLAKDRRDRFADAGELRAALEDALHAVIEGRPEGPDAPMSARPVVRAGPSAAEDPARGRAPAKGERITVGLLFFASDAGPALLQLRVPSLGGQLAHAAHGKYVAAFGQDPADNPARRAQEAAEEMIRQNLCDRVRLDVAQVTAQPRKDGTKRLLSPLFGRADRYPSPEDPPGVHVSPAAAAVLQDASFGATVPIRTPPPPAPFDDTTGTTGEVSIWPTVGRSEVLDALVASARRSAADRQPTVVTVEAEAGQGKSHLFRVLVRRLAEEGGAVVIDLRARELALGDVDRTLQELLRRALDVPASPPSDGGEALLRERLGVPDAAEGPDEGPKSGPDVAAVALALGWLSHGELRSAMAPALRRLGAAPGALRAALTVAAGTALRRRAARAPLFVVIDDAHLAGDVVFAALAHAAGATSAPLWICALGRPPLLEARPTWASRAELETHQLGPLDPASAAELCRYLLRPAENVPDSIVQRLVQRAEAVPLFLVELVRGLRREGIVRRSPKGNAWFVAADELDRLPDLPLVEWFARGEVEALAPALRGHARLLALAGDGVTVADVEGILRGLELLGGGVEAPLDARIGTQRLVAAGLVAQDRGGRVGFRHALVREAIARATPEPARRRIHLAAALHYQGAPQDASEERRLSRLAHHASEAGMAAVAERSYLELARRARTRHAYLEAERLYSRALEQPVEGSGADRAAAYRGRGLMRYRIGRYHDALTDLSCARAMVHEAGDRTAEVEILLDEATALDWMDEYKASEERIAEAGALLPGVSTPLLEARLLLGRGRSAFRFGRHEEAARLLEEAVVKADDLGDDGYETLVLALMLLGFLLPGLAQFERAQRAVDRAIALADAHGDRLHLGGALNLRAMLRANLGDKAGMVADMERSLAVAREIGQLTLELAGEFNLAEQFLLLDDPEAAAPHIQRAIVLDRMNAGDRGRADVVLIEARLRLQLGDGAGARAVVRRLRERQAEAQARGEDTAWMSPSDDVLGSTIDLSTRDATGAEWDALEERSERFSVGQERLEVIEARALALARGGHVDEARLHLERALDLASRITTAMIPRLRRRLAELARR